jgi:hypothetical protein
MGGSLGPAGLTKGAVHSLFGKWGEISVPRRLSLQQLCLATSIHLLLATPLWAQLPLQVIAHSGDAAPGTGETFNFFSFEPHINEQGQIAFKASMTGSTNFIGLWAGSPGAPQLVARSGHTAPEIAGGTFNSFDLVGLADTGEVAFHGSLQWGGPIGGANDEAYWAGLPGDLHVAAHKDDPPPPAPGVFFNGIGSLSMDAQGNLAYTRIGMYHGTAGSMSPQLLPYDPADGAGDDVFTSMFELAMNDHGQFVMWGSLYDPDTPSFSGSGLWMTDAATPGQSTLIARGELDGNEGVQPGPIAPGSTFPFFKYGFGSASLNNNGRFVFPALLDDPAQSAGVWTGTPGNIEKLLIEGDSYSIEGDPLTVEDLDYALPLINGLDEIVFSAQFAGTGVDATNDRAILVGTSNADLEVLVREGDRAPGTPDGIVFDRFSHDPSVEYLSPVLNARGQMAFYGILTGPGVDESNDIGLWATMPSGRLALVAREGDVVEFEPGSPGVISRFYLETSTNGEDGRGTSLNNRNQLVFAVELDNSLIYEAVVMVRIPEPASGLLALGALAVLLPYVRCHRSI